MGRSIARLKTELRAKLHFTRAFCAEDAAEVGVAKDPVRKIEVRLVEQIEHFPTELELCTVRNRPRSGDSQIQVCKSRPDDAVPRCISCLLYTSPSPRDS